jgi:integrase
VDADPKVAGVQHRKPHAARHSFASRLIEQGESLAYVRDQLGHPSIKITVDIYGHLTPGANRAAVDKLDAQEPRGRSGRAEAMGRPAASQGRQVLQGPPF